MSADIEGALIAGRYRVGAVIGSGAMSIVREAIDLRLSRRVALKLIQHGPSLELAERLFREAKAAARANHPAIVTVFGYGTDHDTGLHYLAMERLLGEDLATRLLRSGRLPLPDALRIGADVADALASVHEAGVVHRDLKPANVFLASYGRRVDEVKLLDFGVARQFDLQTLTATGEIVGTLAYMAPEQLMDPKRVDPRSDIYALGVMMFESLVGRLPYTATGLGELAQRVMTEDGPRPESIEVELPPDVVQLLIRCLRRLPRDRFASARALCDAMSAALPQR
jgi:eukaryotic-like serine/threonine-protein kinase